MRAPKYTEAEKAAIIASYARLRSPLRVAKAIGKSSSGVSHFLVTNGYHKIRRSERPWLIADEKRLAELWNAKKSTAEIAATLNRTETGIRQYAYKHKKRLGIVDRCAGPWQLAEKRLLAREVDVMVDRICAGLPHRSRPVITQKMVAHLYGDSRRRKIKSNNARIQDVGGMAALHSATVPRAEHTPKPRAKAAA
jgi:DNA-binding CsgD family transcriptional regulator